jgi:hypothetical protein
MLHGLAEPTAANFQSANAVVERFLLEQASHRLEPMNVCRVGFGELLLESTHFCLHEALGNPRLDLDNGVT